ncbi:MAG: hypothetical protein HKO70_13550 [Acidimicrobiia bacterium]|nr:hypothetical protein [Acidimicrobiia bacterium]
MFWFGRPSYLRIVAAAALILAAAAIEFWPQEKRLYPFAATSMEAGDPLAIEWRPAPAGLFAVPALSGTVASHAIGAGEPISAADVGPPVSVPDGWWALPIEAPTRLEPGALVRLVLATQSTSPVPGTVVGYEEPDRFSAAGPVALIAVPGEHASAVAAAVSARQLVVLVDP